MASASLAFDPIRDAGLLTSCSPTAASLASTDAATSDEEEGSSVRSRSSSEGALTSEQLPDLSQMVLQELRGTWIGQGANYGELHAIEAAGAAWRCKRSGLCGAKTTDLSWDALSGRLLLGGRYALDHAALLEGTDQAFWSRLPGKGQGSKQVVWKRRLQSQAVRPSATTAVECKTQDAAPVSEDLASKLVLSADTPEFVPAAIASHRVEATTLGLGRPKRVYSRAFMLGARYGDVHVAEDKVGITLKTASDIQFVCPAPSKEIAHMQRKQPKIIQKKTSKTTRDTVAKHIDPAPGTCVLHGKDNSNSAAEEQFQSDFPARLAAISASLVLAWLTETPESRKPAGKEQMPAVAWDPLGISVAGAEGSARATEEEEEEEEEDSSGSAEDVRESKLAAALAKLLLALPSSSLRISAPEFVPSVAQSAGATQLRVEAPEPGAEACC